MTDELAVAIAGSVTISVLFVIAKFTFLPSMEWWICLLPIWLPLLLFGIFSVVVFMGFMIRELIESIMYR
jgi:hypothetical protein